ncbi:oxidoreductase-like domain-containing protein [Marinomonas aquimarina]|nr:oxidoreductase-like domain-containing protein [Marinomonas aquimarina]
MRGIFCFKGPHMNNKPSPPEDWECCESGCEPCVWDTYYEALRDWNAQQKALSDATPESDSNNEN